MGQNNSPPLETLAAFTLVFFAGAISAVSIIKYIERIRFETIVLRRCDHV